ncbi:MAG: hypothetical protein KTR19_11360 [Hyphomicrobiales bacterium]|nr:hypothetical protein [Hyphomicrobiales bacterium]
MKNRSYRRWPVFVAFFVVLIAIGSAVLSSTVELALGSGGGAGNANGEPLVMPDCENSAVKISPCQRVAASWLAHLNARAYAFVDAFRSAGYEDDVTNVVLDCSLGVLSRRKTRDGGRWSRHAFAEACDGNRVRVNDVTFSYRRAVRDETSVDRAFFVTFLDGWADVGPGCIPEKGYTILGNEIGCRPIMADNCGVIDWRERGANSQYGSTYHLSFCQYSDFERAYE